MPIDKKYYSGIVQREDQSSASLLREARRNVQLSQTELAQRAGVAQSVISAYESGRREPALSTLRRLIGAMGIDLVTSLELTQQSAHGLPDTLMGSKIRQRRRAILRVAAKYGVWDLKIFGSVARGDDNADSDVDIVATLPGSMGLVELGSLERELSEILGRTVDLVPSDGIRPHLQREIDVDGIFL